MWDKPRAKGTKRDGTGTAYHYCRMSDKIAEMRKGDTMTKLAKTIANFGLSAADASLVAEYYIKERIAKVDGVDGSVKFAHGAFLDADVLSKALQAAKGE